MAQATTRRSVLHSRAAASLITIAVIGALASLGANPALAASATWSPPVSLTGVAGETVEAVTAPDGTITTVIESFTNGITAVSSTDAGATWQAPVALGSGGDFAFRATIGITSTGLLAIAWVESLADVRSLQIVISADGGATWSSPTALPTVSTYVDDPAIGSSSPLGFTVVWTEDTFDKLSSATTDGGTTWSANSIVTENMNSYGAASLAAVGASDIVVVYQEFDGLAADYSIQSRRSTDGGVTWETPVPVAPAWSGSLSNTLYNPVVSPAPGSLIAVWTHARSGGGDALFAATSTDSGATWSPVIEIFADATSMRYFTIAIVDASTVGIVWHQDTDAGPEALYAEVELGATASSTPVLVDASPTAAYDRVPTLTAFGETRVATWLEDDGDNQAFRSAVSCDGGSTWRAATTIAAGSNLSTNDAVAARSGTVVTALWSDYDAEPDVNIPLASSIDDPCSVPVAEEVDPELAATGMTDSVATALMLGVGLLVIGAGVLVARRPIVR